MADKSQQHSFGEKPTKPVPDDSGAWLWFAGDWRKIIIDSQSEKGLKPASAGIKQTG